MKPTIIKERDLDDEIRKAAKKKYDSIFALSNSLTKEGKIKLSVKQPKEISLEAGSKMRLLDEGTCLYDAENIRFVLMKGAIKRWYDELNNDFVGIIKYGHGDFGNNPITLGIWTKDDLELVDIGDGKIAVDVIPHFYEGLSKLDDLRLMPYTVGISSEFMAFYNEKLSDEKGVPYIQDIDLDAFAVVGDVGNVNSGGISLNKNVKKEGNKMALDILKSVRTYLDSLKSDEKDNDKLDEDKTEAEVETEGETVESENEETELNNSEIDEILKESLSTIEELHKENKDLRETLQELYDSHEKLTQKNVELSNKIVEQDTEKYNKNKSTIESLQKALKDNKADKKSNENDRERILELIRQQEKSETVIGGM